ncbi:MATE family efflux transporter [Clostridium beijerinckii]|uniref:MATE family efflux transporter n=1 Tax=Clostridium beijerinckii TaxID=1520 RepID=UPI0022E226AC|nr:MATE family efflux transporter [Clostridium beijerinckii]
MTMESKQKKIKIMSEGNITKALFTLGIPIIFGMFITSLYNIVDAIFVGSLGTSQMGAVSISYPILQLIIGLGLTFGSGCASYVSRLLGQKENHIANQAASTALISSIIIGIITVSIIMCFLDKILTLLGATSTILIYAHQFAIIYIPGSILNIINVTMNNISASEGAAKISMISMLMGALINTILEPIFIFQLKLGIQGAAIATVIAQGITTILYVWYIHSGKSNLHISIKNFCPSKTIYSQIFKVGIPTLLFQILSTASMALTNTAASRYGDSAVAAMGVMTRIMALGTYVIFGYAKGFQPIAGFSYGAKNYKRLKEAISVSLKWSTIFCIILEVIFIIFAKQIVTLFTKDTSVISIGIDAVRANSLTYITLGVQYIYATLFLSLGKATKGMLASISRQGIFFIPLMLVLPNAFGINGIIFVQPLADILTTIFTIFLTFKLQRKINSDVRSNEVIL